MERILIIKNVEVEDAGELSEFLKEKRCEIEIVEIWKNERYEINKDFSGIVLLGGPMNVYQNKEYPFLLKEEKIIKFALNKKIPFLGICLGAQLLAKVLGAKVKKLKNGEIGWYQIKLTEKGKESFLFKNLSNSFYVFQWHEDTFEIPENTILTAKGDFCKNQAFDYENYAWGIQFHIEVNLEMIKKWIDYYNETIDFESIKRKYFEIKENFERAKKIIFENFYKVIKDAKY